MDVVYNYSWDGISLDKDGDGGNLSCLTPEVKFYPSSFGIYLAVPEWEAVITAIILTFIILATIVGNILVILSVFTYKPLRIVQNFFIVSLAVADLTVALLVMPLNVAYAILGEWIFGIHMCKMWLTSDVMCCTSSILNLCAIALDRFWAITDPINYAQKRTLERVVWMIAFVWILSLIISSPPLFGWNDWPEEFTPSTPCQLTSQPGYVIYSSAGSFYIPLLIMTVVYIEIFIATRKRLRERAKATRINAISSKNNKTLTNDVGKDTESISSETHQEDRGNANKNACAGNRRVEKMKNYFARDEKEKNKLTVPILAVEESDNVDLRNTSSESNSKETHEDNTDLDVNIIKKKSESVIVEKGTVYQFIEEKQRISLSRERRAARTLGIIMGVFVVCWLPFFLMYVIVPFCSTCCPSAKLINFITWLGYVNSALNPVIYTIFNMDFRRAFKKLLCIN